MNRFEELRKANSQINIQEVNSEAFRPYGKVINSFEPEALIQLSERVVPIPEEGIRYFPAIPELDTHPDADILRNQYLGQLDAQIGICHGHNNRLNALEYHKSSEINIAVTDLVLLLADQREMELDNRISSDKVKGFYLHKGDVVEVYATTLHYCPCEVENGFSCIVVLPRNTNKPLNEYGANQEDELLFAKNKWLLAHEDNSALINRGAKAKIYGQNLEINLIETGRE
ncbi:MAG: hypothetical protein K0R46_394 [Herbinix sp.]|jgi:hypothetical protein|nr:hypothetical protein [Herbinix sp.]